MARCFVLEDFSVRRLDRRTSEVTLEAESQDALAWFSDILIGAFPEAKLRKQGRVRFAFLGLHVQVTLSGEAPSEELESLLGVVARSLTIEDSLDECHALGYHQEEDETTGKLSPSILGRLVYSAKYKTHRPSREKIGAALEGFIRAHPRYSSADVIASVPSHGSGTTSGLSGRLANQLAAELDLELVRITRATGRQTQKDITDEDRQAGVKRRLANQKGSMRVDEDLEDLSVIVIDDLYGSGATMLEADRALREAGASEVFGLTVTKQRLYGGVRLTPRGYK